MFARCSNDIFDGDGFWESSLTSALNYPGMLLDCLEDSKQHLVKNDVILSEGLGDPIPKQEHSYSCSIASDGDSVPSSPVSLDLQDDMESECFPCIPMKKASQDSLFLRGLDQNVYIKSEPLSPSPPPPLLRNTYTTSPSYISSNFNNNIKQEPESIVQVKQESVTFVSKPSQQSLLKTSPITTRMICPKVSVKLDDSCTLSNNISSISSVTTGTTTAGTGSTSVLVSRQRILPAVRQTISSPLISTQLKGSSGVIYLTEEEKRTLISEGYPIPTKLPLSKAEERSLKKIRRKIKNKISAQESRRKKKEYMDSLERKYDLMQNEANLWRSKAEALQAKNAALAKQVAELEDQLQLSQVEKAGSGEITYIVPVHRSMDIQSDGNQDKNEVTEFQDITSNCLDIDVD